MQRVGTAVECPLWLEWERVTHRFCALVYATSVRIFRVAATPTPEVTLVHEIPTAQRVVSVKWFHQTLFLATEDGVLRCCFVSKSRMFAVDLADRAVFSASTDSVSEFPRPQPLVDGLSTILGVVQHRLVVAAPVKSLHFVALDNLVFQCCLLIAIGQPDVALSVAETLRRELTDWLAAGFEAFGFVTHALRLSKLSLRLRIGMLIKHDRLDDLEKLLEAQLAALPPSPDTTGTSPLQLGCLSLVRGGRCEPVEQLFRAVMTSHRYHDAVYIASILRDDKLLAEALTSSRSWGGALLASKRASSASTSAVLSQWNKELQSSTAPWRRVLDADALRGPDVVSVRIYDEALEKDIDATFQPLNELINSPVLQASTPQYVVVVCSTTGNGDPPDNAAKLWRFLKRRTQPKNLLQHVVFTVLGLGDTNYDKFCYMGKSIDKRMTELGAQRFYDMCAADEAMGLEDSVEPWLDGLWGAFSKATRSADHAETCSSSSEDGEDAVAPTTPAAAADADEEDAPAKRPYLPENLQTYDAMFGPFTDPTPEPSDVPRLQNALFTVSLLDAQPSPVAASASTAATDADDGGLYSSTQPYVAKIHSARYLTKPQSERKVLYVELDISGAKMPFKPGDSIGVKCPNRTRDVDALLERLELDGATWVNVEPTPGKKTAAPGRFPPVATLRELLSSHVDLQASPKKAALRTLATCCTDDEERARMLVLSSKSGADAFKRFVTEQQLSVVELLHLFPSCRPSLDTLLSLLPQLMPRFYSIATSPLVDANKIGIAFTVVDERIEPHGIQRRGLCTTWLESVAQPWLAAGPAPSSAVSVPIFLRPTRDFTLPASHEWPLLLIGPGTGVAPFMGFLQHRQQEVSRRVAVASEVCSGCWRGDMELELTEDDEFATPPALAAEPKGAFLFFGCRRRDQDWIFEDEMTQFARDGTLRGLFTAFSREQQEKHYVQHELRAHGALVADLVLQQGGYVFVCGDGVSMAKDVHEALRDVLVEHGGAESAEAAEAMLRSLVTRQRYVRDICVTMGDHERVVELFLVATCASLGSSSSHAAPELSFAYPVPTGHDETDFCENVTMSRPPARRQFVFPHGYVASLDDHALPPPPIHHLFTLTDARGAHLFGASLSFFEPSGVAKALCLLARRPLYTALLRYLEQLWLVGLEQASADSAVFNVERALTNLFHEVPAPHRGLAVQLHLAGLDIVLERPPLAEFPFELDGELVLLAFMAVDPKVLCTLFHHVLLEHRVLVVGGDGVLVTAIVETLRSLLFPLAWLHVVVPTVPDALDLSTLLDAPVPFLAGAHAAQLERVVVPPSVVRYDVSEGRLLAAPSSSSRRLRPTDGSAPAAADEHAAVLPPLPEASTRLLATLSTIRLADAHAQRRELHQRLWDRRIQLQQRALAGAVDGSPAVTPRAFFLAKQTLVHRKTTRLYVDLMAALLHDFAAFASPHATRRFDADRFVDKKPASARPFFRAFVRTAHFQSFVAQHEAFVRGALPLDDAMRLRFVHRTLLPGARERSSPPPESHAASSAAAKSAPSTPTSAAEPVALAPVKTFVALTPQLEERRPRGRRTMWQFPPVDVAQFGSPRPIEFAASTVDDSLSAALGTLLASPTSSEHRARRASKDGADWMQTFLRSLTRPKGGDAATGLHSSVGGGGPSTPAPAPFLRARTLDRLRQAAPFARTTTQRALDAATSFSSSSSLSSSSSALDPPRGATRARPVVDSIWLITIGACSCRDAIVALTDELLEARRRRRRRRVIGCYCALIDELGACGHPSEAKAVFEECLSGSALLALSGIAAVPSFWRVFSALLRCYVRNGLVQRAFELLVQVQLDDEALLDPALGALRFRAHVVAPPTREPVVERVAVTFSWGNLGLCLIPRCATTSTGCELLSFQRRRPARGTKAAARSGAFDDDQGEAQENDDSDDGVDSDGDDAEEDDDGARGENAEQCSALQPHDVVEAINGEYVLHRAFPDIVLALRQAPRPVTVAFLRGLDRLERSQRSASSTGRNASAASASSTSVVVNGRAASVSDAAGRGVGDGHGDGDGDGDHDGDAAGSLGAHARPRRDLVDRFGWLPRHGIRVSTLADCGACGTRLSLTDVQRGWSSDAHDYTTRCAACGQRFVPRLCVVLGAAPSVKVEYLEYLSTPVIRKELSNLAQKVPLTLLSMRDLREMNPRLYWNIVVKLLALAVPLDFLDLPDMTRQQPPSTAALEQQQQKEERELAEETVARDSNGKKEDLRACIGRMLLEAKQRRTGDENVDDDLLARVIKSVEDHVREALANGTNNAVAATNEHQRRRTERLPHENNDDDNASDDERETDVEDMRSSRTLSVTDSMHSELDVASLSNTTSVASKRPVRNTKFMPSLPSAPFRRISRTVPSLH
ncbi:hypothetical protein P43SY_006462 [Pythium insidiosum]|uniref:Methionine synthase reductase n=1 Tax=Pythium insidiosum TaxID=114742 RepID=A0AAD5Q714_PYTIN|nr:hypothetical protein P43SY_006462 [Pythium insidiosum]